jgi:transposase-like protein
VQLVCTAVFWQVGTVFGSKIIQQVTFSQRSNRVVSTRSGSNECCGQSRSMTRSSGAASTLGNRPLVLIAVKPSSTPGTGPRLWCSNCRYTFTYTRNTPFEVRTLTPGEIIIAFVLYADTLLSINQVAQLFEAVYDTVHTTIREVEAPSRAASTSSGHISKKMVRCFAQLGKSRF